MTQHPGPQFEKDKEDAARERCQVLLKDPKRLTEAIPAISDDELSSGKKPETLLEKVRDEGALHLGNAYYCELRLHKPIADQKLFDSLTLACDQSRKRHDFLMGVAGRLMAVITYRGGR